MKNILPSLITVFFLFTYPFNLLGNSGSLNEIIQSAANGNPAAQFELGKKYYFGKEVDKNITKALQYLKAAADQEHPNALFVLGRIYDFGDVVEQDLPTAQNYYSQAALKGHQAAWNRLQELPPAEAEKKTVTETPGNSVSRLPETANRRMDEKLLRRQEQRRHQRVLARKLREQTNAQPSQNIPAQPTSASPANESTETKQRSAEYYAELALDERKRRQQRREQQQKQINKVDKHSMEVKRRRQEADRKSEELFWQEEAAKSELIRISKEVLLSFSLPSTTKIKERYLFHDKSQSQEETAHKEKQFDRLWALTRDTGIKLGIDWETVEYLGVRGNYRVSSPHIICWLHSDRKNFTFSINFHKKGNRLSIQEINQVQPYPIKRPAHIKVPKAPEPLRGQYSFMNGDMPSTGVKAVYFNYKTGEILHEEVLVDFHFNFAKQYFPDGAIYHNSRVFRQVDKKDLAVYLAGNYSIPINGEYYLGVNITHWARYQLDIDAKNSAAYGGVGQTTMQLSKGSHQIEVLYQPNLNGKHWTEFSLVIKPEDYLFSRAELQKELKPLVASDTRLFYAAAYEPEGLGPVRIELSHSESPMMLLLSTIDAPRLIVQGPGGTSLKAVVFTGPQRSDVRIAGDSTVPIYRLIGFHGIDWIKSIKPKDYAKKFMLKMALESADKLFPGKKIEAFSCAYSADLLTVPGLPLSKENYETFMRYGE